MPSDIRNFFGGKADGPAVGLSQEQNILKEAAREKKPKGRSKRKVVSDSDEEEVQTAKKATPRKPPPKKSMKENSPVGEVTTTSDYFASSGKSKPTRSTPTKAKAFPEKKIPEKAKAASARSSPKSKMTPKTKPATNGKTSYRQKNKPQYAEMDNDDDDDDEFEPKIVNDDSDSGEDIFGADYKHGKRGGKDAYESDGEEDVVVQPARKTAIASRGTSSKKNVDTRDEDDDFVMKDVPMKDIPEYSEAKPSKATNANKATNGRKRKSVELDDDDEGEDGEDVASTPKKLRGPKAKSPTKKTIPKKRSNKEDQPPEKTETDNILDNITQVKAPTPPPRDEGKKFNYAAFNSNRTDPPASSGPTDLPEGAENCLAGLTFVFTGILNTLGREKGQELVKRYGGKITGAPSKKTSFVVIGSDAGPKKLETIKLYNLRTIDEQGLFELIRKLPANGGDGKAAAKFEETKKKDEAKIEKAAAEMEKLERAEAKRNASSKARSQPEAKTAINVSASIDSRLWTVKYAPTATNMICGNKGQVEKLQAWLRAWPVILKQGFRKGGKDGWGAFRAMMLYGPPGIGKTTAAHLAAKLEGYDILESNASDTRSKKLVEVGLRGVLDTTSLLGYFSGDGKKVESEKKRLVLIMDEVDGMSAGDRGGVGALAALCKKNHVPIILICNDRKLPKMKPFDHVAFDLSFKRPTTDQIRQRIMTICFREKLMIPPNVINALIEGSHADIRQVINMLSTAKLDQDAMDFDSGKKMSKSWEKHVILKPWDIVSKILGGGLFAPSSTSTLNDKIELYFNDHEFSSLMLQENYLGTNPMLSNTYSGKEKSLRVLELVDQAAESISDGDLVDRMIHGSQQQWSLMPTHAVFSFVRPASFVSGSQAGSQTGFTKWLGNNSKQGKLMRFIKEVQGHMRLRASGNWHEIRQQYLPLLWYRLIKELQVEGKDGIDKVIELMDSYYLTKDDWEAILELGVGPMDMEHTKIESQTKSAFTREYNKASHPLPYMKASQVIAPKKKSKERPDIEDALEGSDSGADTGDDQAVLDEDEPLDLKKDRYVKAPKKKKKPAKEKNKVKEGSDEGMVSESDGDVKPRKPVAKKGKGRVKK